MGCCHGDERVQNMPQWVKGYFVQKAFEFLKSLTSLKVEPRPSLGAIRGDQLITEIEKCPHHAQTDAVTTLSYLPSILLRPLCLSKKSSVFPKVPFSSSSSPIKMA